MAFQTETLKHLLLYLEEKIRLLSDKRITEEELKKENGDLRVATERRLQLAIEACIDVARHLIAAENLGIVEHNKDAILLLGEKKIIPHGLAGRVASATDMRNVLVHGYRKITYQDIEKAIKGDIGDLKEFAKYIEIYTSKKE